MILQGGGITIGTRRYEKGERIPGVVVYPFFLVHMLMFGGSGFLMAYSDNGPPLLFLYAHGGFAILCYTAFYLAIFGRDEVRWMFINAGLGILGTRAWIDHILGLFGRRAADYPLPVHIIPFLYFILYTFLLRRAVLDLSGATGNEPRRKLVENAWVASLLAFHLLSFLRKPA